MLLLRNCFKYPKDFVIKTTIDYLGTQTLSECGHTCDHIGALINLASKFNVHVAFILSCPTVYYSTIRTLLPSGQTRLKRNVLCCFGNEGNIFVGGILYTHQENSPFILIFHTSQDMWATTAQPLQNREF